MHERVPWWGSTRVSDWKVYCPLAEVSQPLILNPDVSFSEGHAPTPIRLSLFESAVVHTKKDDGASGGSRKGVSEGGPKRQRPSEQGNVGVHARDIVMHVGGAVWALDWCPVPEDRVAEFEYFAVGTHPASQPTHKNGEPSCGPLIIQIWAMRNQDPDGHLTPGISCDDGRYEHLPQMVLGIAHEGGATWDVKWRPPASKATGDEGRGGDSFECDEECPGGRQRRQRAENARLGYLAAALGDGSVQIFDVPRPEIDDGRFDAALAADAEEGEGVEEDTRDGDKSADDGDSILLGKDARKRSRARQHNPYAGSGGKGGGGGGGGGGTSASSFPVIAKLPPVFVCDELHVGERRSIPMVVEWAPHGFYDRLLAGCHDGRVALWNVHLDTSADPLTAGSHKEMTHVRPLLYFTADSAPIRALAWAPCGSGWASQHYIAVSGNSGLLRFWDLRDPHWPIWELHLSRGWVLGLDWLPHPRCMLMCLDDATVRILSFDDAAAATPVTGKGGVLGKDHGMHAYVCGQSAIWGIDVSRHTGQVAYCNADGRLFRFQLTVKAVTKGHSRYRELHYVCGVLARANDHPLSPIAVLCRDTQSAGGVMPGGKLGTLEKDVQSMRPMCKKNFPLMPTIGTGAQIGFTSTNPGAWASSMGPPTPGLDSGGEENPACPSEGIQRAGLRAGLGGGGEAAPSPSLGKYAQFSSNRGGGCGMFKDVGGKFQSKVVAITRVRWNPNKTNAKWLIYGSTGGLVRCQYIES